MLGTILYILFIVIGLALIPASSGTTSPIVFLLLFMMYKQDVAREEALNRERERNRG